MKNDEYLRRKKTLLDLKKKMVNFYPMHFFTYKDRSKVHFVWQKFCKKVFATHSSNNVLCHQKWISQPKNRENQSVKSILTEKIVVKVKKSSYSNYMLLFFIILAILVELVQMYVVILLHASKCIFRN